MTTDSGYDAIARDADQLGEQLDADHAPETNGRMSICRRCGVRTVGEFDDRHAPVTIRAARVRHWLDAQALARRTAQFRGARDT